MSNLAKPLLSIVTVTKDCVGSLDKTLMSVSAIKTGEIEYIIVDGASTDGTLELIKRYEKLVDKFISEPDSGIYSAMNKGLDLASGKYTLFINGDDELLSDGFQVIWPILLGGSASIVSAKTKVLNEKGDASILVAKPWQLSFFNSIPHPSTFVLTTLLRKYRFREDLRIASDYDLFLRLMLDGNYFIKVDALVALHHRGGASANSILSLDEVSRIRKERLGKLRLQLCNYCWYLYRMIKTFFGHL
ncbi:glycosyltransferase [Polynucleobacter paneuropaeus]|nr:glycosyltransferase [Polynucleobacter paneuropaeus]